MKFSYEYVLPLRYHYAVSLKSIKQYHNRNTNGTQYLIAKRIAMRLWISSNDPNGMI